MLKSGAALVAGAVAALFAAEARAATILVGPGDSIQDAIDGAVAGDTVKVLNGRYNQAITLTKYVKLQGESKTGVILDGAGLAAHVVTLDEGLPASLVKNLTIAFSDQMGVSGSGFTAANVESTVIKGCRDNGIYLEGSGTITVKGNTFRANNGWASVSYADMATVQSNKAYRGPSGLLAQCETSVFAKGNSTEDVAQGLQIEASAVTSDSNSSRRGNGRGLTVFGGTATILKGSHRSMHERGVVCSVTGEGTTITSVTVKKCRDTAVEVDGGGVTVTGLKSDLCSGGLDIAGSGNTVTLSSFRLGNWGIALSGSGCAVTSSTFKMLRDGGINVTSANEIFIDSNTLTEIGTTGLGAITVLGSYDGQVSRNVIGDVDYGDGIYVEAFGYFRVGGFVGEYQGGNTVTSARKAGIRMSNPFHYGLPASPPVGLYGPRAAFNTVTSCGDLDSAGIASWGVQSNYIYLNTVTQSAGSGIEISTGTHYATIFGNLVADSGTNGILLDGGNVSICTYPSPWGCYAYSSFGPGAGNTVVSNIVTGSGSEGIDNGAFATIIADNTVSLSGIHDFANGGSVDSSPSTGNTPQPSDWNAVPSPAQLDY